MERFDLALAGSGFLPAVLALQLRMDNPDRRILMLSGDREIPGRGLELVFLQRLGPAAAAVIAPCIVREWPGLLAVRGGKAERIEEVVALLDPLQLWAELLDHFDPGALVAGCGDAERGGDRVSWPGGQAVAEDFIDLRPLTAVAADPDIVAGETLAGLELPVLSEEGDEGALGGEAPQWLLHVPIGNAHVAVRKLCHRTVGWIPREITGVPGPDYYQFLGAIGSGLA